MNAAIVTARFAADRSDRQRPDPHTQKLRAIRVAKTELLSWLQEQG